MDIFISHSSKDSEFAVSLVRFLRVALRLSSSQILCTSVEETQLIGGAKEDEKLRQEIFDSKVFVAVLSPTSINSIYVQFELGARWGANKKIFPLLLPSLDLKQISGPLIKRHIVMCNRAGLWNLIQHASKVLDVKPESPESMQNEIGNLLKYKPSNYTPLAFAVLSYVVDKEFNFALLKDSHYKTIQPPGRRLQPNERPDEVALESVREELDLPTEELQRFPRFTSSMYNETRLVPPPYQVQVEKNPHRTALVHYDFVYVFYIDRVRPPTSIRASKEHKSEPEWYSIEKVEQRQDGKEYGPHEDMIPTMRKIKVELDKALNH